MVVSSSPLKRRSKAKHIHTSTYLKQKNIKNNKEKLHSRCLKFRRLVAGEELIACNVTLVILLFENERAGQK
jgi:hypothetical protein